jgi:hypothetical protein
MGEMDRAEGLLELAVSLDPANEAAATDLRTLSEAMGERGEPTEVK